MQTLDQLEAARDAAAEEVMVLGAQEREFREAKRAAQQAVSQLEASLQASRRLGRVVQVVSPAPVESGEQVGEPGG